MEGKALEEGDNTKLTQPLKNTDQTQQTMSMMQKLRNHDDVNSQDNIMPNMLRRVDSILKMMHPESYAHKPTEAPKLQGKS